MSTTSTRAKDPKIVAESQKVSLFVKKVGTALVVVFVMLIILIIPMVKTEETEEKIGQAPSTQSWQLCAGDYNFSNKNLPATVKIDVRTDCWAPVTLPPNINFRTHVDTDMKIVFIDGAEFIDGPDKQVWYGEFRKEIFKVRGIKEAGTLEISMEKKI